MKQNRISDLFNIQYPVIQAGMVWCSGWKLAAACSNAGILGLIGAGSMYPEVLREHIQKCKKATSKPFGVNIPLLYPEIDKLMEIVISEKVPVVFTSAGNPKIWTSILQKEGIRVVHVVSSSKFAQKSEEAGVDAVVAEGFEAGGHNGREETTSMCLIPLVKNAVKIPVIAAGGIGSGRAMLAAMVLGADGVQIGSRFVPTIESSAHENYKNLLLNIKEGDTVLTLKELAPVRLIKNKFYSEIEDYYKNSADIKQLKELLGRGRAKKGMFLGDLEDGELEIGQVSATFANKKIQSAAEVITEILLDFEETRTELLNYN